MLKFLLVVSGLLAIASEATSEVNSAVASAAIQRKCLFPHFITNHTTDGLTNCVCPKNMEYDPVYGICFINQCKKMCGEMNCHIRKSNINNFQYFCSCDMNYEPITSQANIGCTAFEENAGFREAARRLPRNPMFLKRLGCSHTYTLVDGKYRCACFDGYTLNEATGECRPKRKCDKICGKNQVCAVSDQNESRCVCKAGFSGPDCTQHFCEANYKGASLVERTYLDLSIREVCGVAGCRLDDQSNSFSCNCNFGLVNRPDGLCGLPTPCLPETGAGYEQCTNGSNFCIIALDKWETSYKCYPPLEQSGKPTYTAKFNRSEKIDFKLSMDVRLNWWEGSFYILFVNQMNNLQSPGWQKQLPKFLWKDFLDYEQRVFWSFEEAEFYREQLNDKLRNMLWKGIKSFFHGWYAPMKDCGNYSVYPAIEYDRTALKMNRLIESIIHVDFEVTCDNLTLTKHEVLDLFITKQIKKDYIDNYWYMHEAGYVLPESVRVSKFRGEDDGDDKGNVDDGDKGDETDDDGKEKIHNKCLDPRKKTDYSLDGITNCTCIEGYELDEMFGVCFENKCKQICGESMECAILKHNIEDFEYFCYCKPGYHPVDPYYPKGCEPSLTHFEQLLDSAEKRGHPLPLNPFLMEQLKCDQMYRLDTDRKSFICDCYRGWTMNRQTSKCEKIKGLIAHDRPNNCTSNEIFVVAHSVTGAGGKCVCKAGFGGPQCSNNLCNWPTPSESAESVYVHESIEQFCGGSRCGLAFDQFLCQCPEPFSKDRNGRCVLHEHCTRPQNYGACSKDKFCKILTNDPLRRPYKCVCPVEQGGELLDECVDFKIDPHKYCLPGYVVNPNPAREFPQPCVRGESSFNFTFKIRFSLEANAGVLLENFHKLNDSIRLNRVPVILVDDFVNYRSRSLAYSMNGVMNKAIVRDKLQDILRQAISRHNYDTDCHRINAVPLVSFNEKQFNLFRLSETLADANISVTCANSIGAKQFVDQFKRHLLHNQANENYYLMRDVGYVLPESIRIL